MTDTQEIQIKADDFAYVTFKMQANLYETDEFFYGVENTVERICSCILSCTQESQELLSQAKRGIVDAFNRLKNEENLPILSYDTITDVIKYIDDKSKKGVHDD